jgi:hypothetical protein
MTDREAMQMALDAMESFESGTNGLYKGEFAEERKALRDRLAQLDTTEVTGEVRCKTRTFIEPPAPPCSWSTEAHLWQCLGRWSAYLVQEGKNANLAPPDWLCEAIMAMAYQPGNTGKPEPVAWMFQHEGTGNVTFFDNPTMAKLFEKDNVRWSEAIPLYTQPTCQENRHVAENATPDPQ